MTSKLILIKNGNVIDGTGQPSYKSDILISELSALFELNERR